MRIMEKRIETTFCKRGYVGVIWGLMENEMETACFFAMD